MPLTPTGAVQRWDAYRTHWSLLFQRNLDLTPTFWERFATAVPSTTKKNAYIWMDRVPQMRKWLGERMFFNPAVRYQEIVNELFELSINLKRTDLEDDELGVFDQVVPEIARASKIWPDVQCAAALQAGNSTLVYDGQNFFDQHPVNPDNAAATVPGTNYNLQYNNFTGAASGNQPGALPFSAPNVAIAYQTMASWYGPDLAPMNVVPDVAIVPPSMKFIAKEVLDQGSELIAKDIALLGGSHGAAAPSNVMRGTLDYIVNPFLANDPTTWYLACTTRATKGIIFQLRESPEQVFFTRPTDTDVFMHDELKWGVRARGAAGFAQWFLMARCAAS
jgi:phage major head subunit gpT-like protein